MSADAKGLRDRVTANPEAVMTEELGRLLGPMTARAAVRVTSLRTLGVAAEQMKPADVPKVLEALRPMLTTLLGAEPARLVVEAITRRFAP